MGNAYTWKRSIVAPRGFAKPIATVSARSACSEKYVGTRDALHYRTPAMTTWRHGPGPQGAVARRASALSVASSVSSAYRYRGMVCDLHRPRDGGAPNPPSCQDVREPRGYRPLARRLPPSAQK